jgi:hypothetical protein
MPNAPRGTIIFKSFVEHDVKFLYGTPYILIVENEEEGRQRLYVLDTEKDQYVSVQEWDAKSHESHSKWYDYALKLQNKIFDDIDKERGEPVL